MLAKIYGNKKLSASRDGSVIFYSLEYAETYRAKSVGAFTESFCKFVYPTLFAMRDIRILDICFGMGSNCAVTFEYRKQLPFLTHIVSIEKDSCLLSLVNDVKILIPVDGYNILRSCMKSESFGNCSLELYIADAIELLPKLTGEFDYIFFDPFSLKKNPKMWTTAIFEHLKSILSSKGELLTYASGKAVRQMLLKAGFQISARTCEGSFMKSISATV